MKNLTFIGFALVLTSLLFVGCTSQNSYGGNTPTPTAAIITPSITSTNAASSTASVDISNFAFSPAELTVAKGTAVTWTNKDSAPHTVTSTSNAFDSGTLQNTASWTFTFNNPGTYDYQCSIHTSMKGKVIVTG